MATRCTVTIHDLRAGVAGTPPVHLYRHWDGYPAGTGRHLAHIARGITPRDSAEDVAARLLLSRERGPYCAGRYERTRHATLHGDTEYHYAVWLLDDGPGLSIRHSGIGNGAAAAGDPIYGGGLAGYRREIAIHLRRLLWRIRSRRRRLAS